MVFQTIALLARARGPDEFWRKRKIFRLSAHFKTRAWNCYSNAIRAVHRSLQFATKSRDPKREWVTQIWKDRIESGCLEHGMHLYQLKDGLSRCNIHINHKSLADLAIWEPRTFKSLVTIAATRLKQDVPTKFHNIEKPKNVYLNDTIK